MSERARSDMVEGFFWCSGPDTRPDLWDYHAIILNRRKRGKNKTAEFRGESPADLGEKLTAAGYEAVGDIKALCEAAPRSPKSARWGKR